MTLSSQTRQKIARGS